MYSFLSLTALVASMQGVYAGFNKDSDSNIAVFWGQNSLGKLDTAAQQNLSHYCESTAVEIIPIAFVTDLNGNGGQPTLNLANVGYQCTAGKLGTCLDIQADIATCQTQHQKTILVSIGGAISSETGFDSVTEAEQAATLLWTTFGPQNKSSPVIRPFGSSVVDGFDFDFERVLTNVAPFAKKLRDLMDQDKSKKWMLTASPQCKISDANNDILLNGKDAVFFDALFVQYYNNPECDAHNFDTSNTGNQQKFNINQWDSWAKTSKNPSVKIFLGLPGGPSAVTAGGYVESKDLGPVIKYCQTFKNFGGVMMWDASQVWANTGFLDSIAGSLGVH